LNPATVKSAVSAGVSVAVESLTVTAPLPQVSDITTLAAELSEKSFATWNWALVCVLVIVHVPLPDGAPVMLPLHVPLDV
jgi:hypothetical protein